MATPLSEEETTESDDELEGKAYDRLIESLFDAPPANEDDSDEKK